MPGCARAARDIERDLLMLEDELAEIARRADNAALLSDLPDLGVSADDVVADLDAARAQR